MRSLTRILNGAAVVAAAAAVAGVAFAGDGPGAIFNIGVTNTADVTSVLRGQTDADQLSVVNTSGTDAATGVVGIHSATAGTGAGVQGSTASTGENATGVYGRATSPSASTGSAAVRGINSGAGMGVYGKNPNDEPTGYGVVGEGRYGLVGKALFSGASSGLWADSPNGFAGVEGHSESPNGFGVYARNTTSGPALYGTSSGGYGVWGDGTYGLVGGGTAGGVWSTTGNPDGSGVFGQFTGPPNQPGGRGVFGLSKSGTGVYGQQQSLGSTNPAVQGDSGSVTPGAVGVLGRVASSSSGGSSAGVRGINNGTINGIGVWGSHAGGGWGVLGTSPTGIGVIGRSEQGFAYAATGQTSQSRNASGWLKAALYYDPHQSDPIRQCFNSQLAPADATAGDCGFKLSSPPGVGYYPLNLGFDLRQRFVLVTPVADGGDTGAQLRELPGGSALTVRTFYRARTTTTTGAYPTNAPFFLVVF